LKNLKPFCTVLTCYGTHKPATNTNEKGNYKKVIRNKTCRGCHAFEEDAFNGLVFADALVTSASSFSYVAAMLTDGVVYYKHFWHKPSMKWIVGDNLRGANNANNANNGTPMRSPRNMWSLCI
jgi:hypothetical protein